MGKFGAVEKGLQRGLGKAKVKTNVVKRGVVSGAKTGKVTAKTPALRRSQAVGAGANRGGKFAKKNPGTASGAVAGTGVVGFAAGRRSKRNQNR